MREAESRHDTPSSPPEHLLYLPHVLFAVVRVHLGRQGEFGANVGHLGLDALLLLLLRGACQRGRGRDDKTTTRQKSDTRARARARAGRGRETAPLYAQFRMSEMKIVRPRMAMVAPRYPPARAAVISEEEEVESPQRQLALNETGDRAAACRRPKKVGEAPAA